MGMPQLSVIFGLALCSLTVYGMVGTTEKLATAFFPMMLGIPLVFCGIVSLNPHRRKAWMLVAGLVAAIGLTAGGLRLVYQSTRLLNGDLVNRFTIVLLWGIVAFCGVYLVALVFFAWRDHQRRKGVRRKLFADRSAAAEALAAEPLEPGTMNQCVDVANKPVAENPSRETRLPSKAVDRSQTGTRSWANSTS